MLYFYDAHAAFSSFYLRKRCHHYFVNTTLSFIWYRRHTNCNSRVFRAFLRIVGGCIVFMHIGSLLFRLNHGQVVTTSSACELFERWFLSSILHRVSPRSAVSPRSSTIIFRLICFVCIRRRATNFTELLG